MCLFFFVNFIELRINFTMYITTFLNYLVFFENFKIVEKNSKSSFICIRNPIYWLIYLSVVHDQITSRARFCASTFSVSRETILRVI